MFKKEDQRHKQPRQTNLGTAMRAIFQPQSRQRQKHSDSKAFFYSFTLFMSFVVKHLDNTTNKRKQGYPEVITCLPEADIQFEGVKAWILQANTRQLVFFEFEADANVPEHSHGYLQWGMVIDGKMELTINGKPRICKKGSEYVIPTGAKHRARFLSRTRVMDFFSEKNRYKPKTIKQAKAKEA